MTIKVSIIIVNYNNPVLIRSCIDSIIKFLYGYSYEIIVIDNGSKSHELHDLAIKTPLLKVIFLHKNMGFGFASNVGAINANSNTLLFLNSDTELIDSSIVTALENFEKTNGKELWGLRLEWPNGKFQNSHSKKISFIAFILNYSAFGLLFKNYSFVRSHKYNYEDFKEKTSVSIIYGTSMIVNKKSFHLLGGFSKKYFMYFEDVDFCERFLKFGGDVFLYPHATLIHKVAGSKKNKSINLNYFYSKFKYAYTKFGILGFLFALMDFIFLFLIIKFKNI